MRKLTSAPTLIRTVLTSQLAQFSFIDVGRVLRGERARREIPLEADRPGAIAVDAQLGAVVAPRLVGPRARRGTLGRLAVALGGPRAVGLSLTYLLLPRRNELASFAAAAWTLTRAALGPRPPLAPLRRTVQLLVLHADYPRITALVLALFVVVAAVALFAGLHYLITAEGAGRGTETVPLFVIVYGIEDVRNVPNTAPREFTIIRTIAACRRREHDEVPV